MKLTSNIKCGKYEVDIDDEVSPSIMCNIRFHGDKKKYSGHKKHYFPSFTLVSSFCRWVIGGGDGGVAIFRNENFKPKVRVCKIGNSICEEQILDVCS